MAMLMQEMKKYDIFPDDRVLKAFLFPFVSFEANRPVRILFVF
jgi:hypothetical protein